MLFSADFIDKIKSQSDIYSVISEYVVLKKRGKNYTGLCCFHNEKSPSFYVDVNKQIYKCFGCGKGGDVISFVQARESLAFNESVRFLAEKFSIDLPENDKNSLPAKSNDTLFSANKFASGFFVENLHSDLGKEALYFLFKRGYTEQTIRAFNLGYSLPDFEALRSKAVRNSFNEESLLKSGLCVQNEAGKIYDKFRQRIMIPLQDVNGKICGFTGRVLSSEQQGGKYVNTSETDIFKKSELLFGLFQAKDEIRLQDKVYLVEGNLDVIAMHQAGIKNVVATSGTALSEVQIKLIKRFTHNVCVIFDSDKAGIRAAIKYTDSLLIAGLNVYAVMLPENEDPDSYIMKNGIDNFKQCLASEKDYISFKIAAFSNELNDPNKKALVVNHLIETVCKIQESIKRNLFFSMLAEKTGVSLNEITKKAKAILPESTVIFEKKKQSSELSDLYYSELKIVRALILYGNEFWHNDKDAVSVCEYILKEIYDFEFENDVFNRIKSIASAIFERTIPDFDFWFNYSDAEISDLTASFVFQNHLIDWTERGFFIESEREKIFDMLPEIITRHKQRIIEKNLDLHRQIFEQQQTENAEKQLFYWHNLNIEFIKHLKK